jgi:urease accessory protein
MLRLRLVERGGKTVVAEQYASAPFKLFRAHELVDGSLVVQVSMTGPGVVSGDRLRQQISIERGARAVVLFTSATKVLGSVGAATAEQDVQIDVAADAQLEYYPGLVIPYPGADFRQRVLVRLATGARFGVLDLWAIGRVEAGEELAFEAIDSRTEVRLDERPAYRDAVSLRPSSNDVTGPGLLEGNRYIASGYWFWPRAALPQTPNAVDDGVLLVTGKPGTGDVYLRALAKDGVALRREVHRVVAANRDAWGLAPLDFDRFTPLFN